MIDTLNQLDIELFLWLNGRYMPWLDPIMIWITERNSWFPLYALLIGWLIYKYRKQAIGFLLTIIAAVAIGDQIASSVLKPLTHRLRPCHELAVQKLMHPVMECGGLYGFVSSHAATTFALATTLWLLLGKRYPWLLWGFLWAAIVSYSRIYVAAHYPLDVLAGTGVGVLSAQLAVFIFRWWLQRSERSAVEKKSFVD
ncbi:phosphatase PAP2 family protein [Spirosoma sp. KCTC 42546]|uniref:phosphatase PAP2 family protein n=1 Tax=Spirosoma sp. KCTC 42546 TaxID=2520506 RepID=UPI001158775E|nr:phosphatase PAP2 family protein [Spirosoma sp. KCTC 42546]QDK80795.1 phosphatase PAP2 family protein [Spirosoma sp. KCTC 42546]